MMVVPRNWLDKAKRRRFLRNFFKPFKNSYFVFIVFQVDADNLAYSKQVQQSFNTLSFIIVETGIAGLLMVMIITDEST